MTRKPTRVLTAPELPEGQRRIYKAIQTLTEKYGYPPTVRELGKACRISSPNGVEGHLVALERKGFITRKRKLSRTLKIVGGQA